MVVVGELGGGFGYLGRILEGRGVREGEGERRVVKG